MRLPISLMSLLVGTSVPALAITLSGKVIDQSGAGKAGVVVSFQGDSSTTCTDGTWSLSVVSTGISSQLSNGRQVTTGGGHLVLDEGHLRVSLSGYDLMGRPRAGSAVTTFTLSSGTPSGISARAATSGIDTFQYLWNGKRFLRDTASVSRSGIVAIFDTIPNNSIIYGWLTDIRDSQVYRTVKIGTQTWMAQNLNYKVDSSWCYDDSASNCATYGRLYRWSSVMALSSHYDSTAWNGFLPHQGICPSGWHVPSDVEWNKLTDIALSSKTSGTVLKANSSSLWNRHPGTDVYGFSVMSTGYHSIDWSFVNLGQYTFFWSSSEDDANASYRSFDNDYAYVSRSDDDKSNGFSLRCLQN